MKCNRLIDRRMFATVKVLVAGDSSGRDVLRFEFCYGRNDDDVIQEIRSMIWERMIRCISRIRLMIGKRWC